MSKYIIVLFSFFMVSACSSLPNWWGDDDERTIDGDRIAVLKAKSKLSSDYGLEGVSVTLPTVKDNKRWYKSSGFHVLTAENPNLPDDISYVNKIKVGKGGEKDAPLTASPVIAEGRLFVIDGWGRVSAFDATKLKKRLWQTQSLSKKNKYRTGQSGLTYHRKRLYVTTGSNEVVALDVETGGEIWRRSINSITRSAPAVNGGRVFVNTIDNRLYTLSAEDGSNLWTHIGVGEDISIFGSAPPVSVADLVFVPYSSGELYTLKATDGREVWSDNLSVERSSTSSIFVDIEASPIVIYDRVVAASSGGVLASIEFVSGATAWEKEFPTTRTPWVAGDYIYVIGNDDQLACIHAASGRVKWVQDLPSYKNEKKKKGQIRWTAPIVAGSKVLIANSQGEMLTISPQTGEIERRHKVIKNVYITPIVAHDRLFLLSDDGVLASYTSELLR
jgi:outer membrane protein assembly factor BamB